MKRLLIFVLTLALLPLTLLTPLSVSAAVEVTDALYEAPDMREYDEGWVIYDPEDKNRTLQCNQKIEMVEINHGTVAAITAPGNSTLIEFKAPYLAKNPISIKDYTYNELALRVQFYVSDPTVFTANCEMELTSSKTCDQMELNFGPNKQQKLQSGWNYMYLPFSEGAIKNGQLDVTNINYMRFYFFLKEEITMALGKIMIVPLEKIGVDATMSTQGWSATDATAADENGMLKMTVNGSGSISTSAYALPIYKPARTTFTFDIKTAEPALIQSLTLQLTDVNGKTAKKNLDTKALKENMLTEFEVICSNLEAHEKFNFEFIKSITLIAQTTAQSDLYFQKLLINSYDSDYFYDWVPGYTTEPGAYSIAVIPDIQELSTAYPHKLNTIMQWIADNKEKENIRFAIDLGDVTWNGHTGDTKASHSEFTNARKAFDILTDAGIEYSIAYGNHDYTPAGRDTSIYNQYFPLELFQSFDSYAGTMDETKSDNTYFTFKGGNTDYLVIALEYTPDNKTIAWANEIVTSHPNHKVIVTTHGYLQGDSAKTVADENALAPAVGADRLWNNLLKKHENIIMLLCGHAWSKSYSGDLVMRQDQGVNGNTVYQIMANAQDIDGSRGGVGMLLMLRFSEDGNVIDFHWFSPVSGETFRPNNQFTLAINNEFSVNGIEDDGVYCGVANFTVNSKTTATVKIGNTVLEPVDGVYTVHGSGRPKTIAITDPFGKKLDNIRITVSEGHQGGVASCQASVICEICGESYGEPLEHVYGEDGKCTSCGFENAPDTPVDDDKSSFSPVFLLPVVAAVVIAGAAVLIACKKKKSNC